MVVKSSSLGSGNVVVRANLSPEYSDYNYGFGEKMSTIFKEMGSPNTSQIVATTHSEWITGKWQDVRFEAKGDYLSIYQNNIPILQNKDNSITHGAIMLGAGGSGWDVCFDNVRVTALRR
jgi:hypothetical protein